MLKVIILLFIAYPLGKSLENFAPDSLFNEHFQNIGPTSIHSIKGKFYEEKQRKLNSKPYVNSEDISNLNTKVDSNSQLQLKLPKLLNPELTADIGRNFSSFNKSNNVNKHLLNDTKVPTLETIDNSIKNLQRWDTNNADPNMSIIQRDLKEPSNTHFHSENVVSSYEKNNTIETIKKELVFDSLLIKSNVNNISTIDINNQAPTNIMDSPMSPGNIPEPDSIIQIDNPIILQLDQPYRRYASDAYFKPIPIDDFQKPRQIENRFIQNLNFEPSDYGYYSKTDKREPKATLSLNNYVIDKNACDKGIDEIQDRNGYDIQLQDPTKGVGISNVGKSRVMLMDHPRVCYACSSINDPSCWSPDRRTAVKYCRADHQSCVTKLYKYKGFSYIIRDCGSTCQQNAVTAGPTKYTTCTICHHDLCNSAYRFKIQNVTIFFFFMFHLFSCIKRL